MKLLLKLNFLLLFLFPTFLFVVNLNSVNISMLFEILKLKHHKSRMLSIIEKKIMILTPSIITYKVYEYLSHFIVTNHWKN